MPNDPLGRTTRWTYDETGNLTALTRPDGSSTTIAYNDLRLPLTITTPDGAIWQRNYDERGNLVAETDPLGATTTYTYDERGHLAQETDALGYVRRVETDAAGLLLSVTDPLEATTRYTRDSLGRVAAITDALGGSTHLAWTTEGGLASRMLPDGAIERWVYDAEGNPVEHVDPLGQVSRIDFGPFDLPRAQIARDGARVSFGRDTELRPVEITGSDGLVWRYEYDAVGRLVRERDFNGRVLTYAYDAAGQLRERTNGAGETTHFAYDLLGNVVEQGSEGNVARFSYDALGRLAAAANADCQLTWERSALGQVLAETCSGLSITSTYDALGRRVSRHTPAGVTTRWEYGPGDRPVGLHAGDRSVRFLHDPLGREIERRLENGVAITQLWDAGHRLRSQALVRPELGAGGDPHPVQRRSYTYRADGYAVGIDDSLLGHRRLDLDAVGRITAVTGVKGVTGGERYAYDAAGNITHASWPEPPPSATAGSRNDLDARGERKYAGNIIQRAGRIRYEHDAQGRLVLRQEKRLSAKPRTWRYTWDADDRMTSVVTPEGERWRYRYDPLGRRIAKERFAGDGEPVVERVDFAWDGIVLAEETHSEMGSPNPQLPGGRCLTWDWEPGTFRPMAQTRRPQGEAPQETIDEQFHLIITDLVGTPTELVSPEGNVAWRQNSTVWGVTAPQRTERTDALDCPLRFPGQYFDAETQTHYNFFRHYDPSAPRYCSTDPLGLVGGFSTHAYVVNPQHWIDPLGLSPYSAVDLIAQLPKSLFQPLRCVECADAMVAKLRSAGIAGERLHIRANRGADFIVNDLVGPAAIAENGVHEAVRVGDIVFDNFFQGGKAYDEYVSSLFARHGITITPEIF